MALLQSLQICGIRSFSPDTTETIRFNTPVTLFLGQNGCGKTTIIESIRFGLTGELPTGSKNGQGFLNDPKMSNKLSTKATIKIKFWDCQGNAITVSRFMSVTAKPGGDLTFKNIMPNLRKRDKDDLANPQDISGRHIDTNMYCSSALNVSKSILNNVLFCHQENSAWPLDESKKLKEKFDEIFDATKYNKCVEILRKYIKERQGNLKVLQARLDHKQSLKNVVEEQRGRLSKKNEELAKVVEEISQKQKAIEPLENRMKEILDLEDTLGTLQRELTGKKAEKKGLQDQQVTIKKHISYVFEGSDEELTDKINSFKSEQTAKENDIKELEKKKKQLSTKSSQINDNIQMLQINIGQFKEEQNQYKKRIEENKELAEKLRAKLELNEFPDVNDREAVVTRLRNALKDYEERYQSLIKEKDTQEEKLQIKINKVREQYAATNQKIESKGNLMSEYQNKIREIRIKLDELDTSDSQLRIVGDRIDKLQRDLSKVKDSFNEAEKLHEIEELSEIVKQKEQYLDKLDREYRILQQNYVIEQKLEFSRHTVLEKQGDVNRIKTKHSQNLRKLFGNNVPERNFRKSIVDIQNREDAKLISLTKRITKLEKEVSTLEASSNHQKKVLESDKRELALKQRKVSDMCKDRPFNEVLQETFQKKEKLQKDKGQYSSAKIMYEAFIKKFEVASPCCPICQTDFTNKNTAIKEIINSLKNKVERIPTQLVQVENELKKEEEFYNKLQQLKTVNDEIEMLSQARIPLAEEGLQNLTENYEEKHMELAAEKASLTSPQELIEACKGFITDATLLDQYLTDINKANMAIEDLEQSIVKVSSNRSRLETEAEIDEVKAELSNKKNRYESCKGNLDQHRTRCQQLNSQIQTETQKQIDIQKLVQQKPLLESQNAEYSEKLTALRQELDELNEVLAAQDKEKRNAEEEKQRVVHANRKLKETEANKIGTNNNILSEILKLQSGIETYLRNNTDGKLNEAAQQLAELKVNQDKLEEAKTKISEAISQKREGLAKQESNFRALTDNVALREKQKLETELIKEIKVLEKNIGGYNYRSVFEEKQMTERNLEKGKREFNSLTGQQEEIKKHVKELERELNKPENKNAYNNYKKQYYELAVEKLAIQDLIKYVDVLERSVLKFHEERMVQINRTIRELWRAIYRGNDIDYIEIKTDEHMTGGVNRRRTYNYKVVQVKNSVELEMRGRCSAGQKVLACLVIRMALAETFSAHCGILALDEPTTNLDRENILSLSDALARIIQTRENEKNFQLLIITHDEEFLTNLTTVNSLDNYWRVKRDQNGFSTVRRQLL